MGRFSKKEVNDIGPLAVPSLPQTAQEIAWKAQTTGAKRVVWENEPCAVWRRNQSQKSTWLCFDSTPFTDVKHIVLLMSASPDCAHGDAQYPGPAPTMHPTAVSTAPRGRITRLYLHHNSASKTPRRRNAVKCSSLSGRAQNENGIGEAGQWVHALKSGVPTQRTPLA